MTDTHWEGAETLRKHSLSIFASHGKQNDLPQALVEIQRAGEWSKPVELHLQSSLQYPAGRHHWRRPTLGRFLVRRNTPGRLWLLKKQPGRKRNTQTPDWYLQEDACDGQVDRPDCRADTMDRAIERMWALSVPAAEHSCRPKPK